VGFHEHNIELSGSINDGQHLDWWLSASEEGLFSMELVTLVWIDKKCCVDSFHYLV
jgi:hypothetical protein